MADLREAARGLRQAALDYFHTRELIPTPYVAHAIAALDAALSRPAADAEAVREACEKAAHSAALYVDETWREGADATAWHPIKAMLIRDAVASATRALPLPAPDDVAMPDEVPSAGAFREAFKNAALPRGADYASWASGYCAGWTAAERAAKGGAS